MFSLCIILSIVIVIVIIISFIFKFCVKPVGFGLLAPEQAPLPCPKTRTLTFENLEKGTPPSFGETLLFARHPQNWAVLLRLHPSSTTALNLTFLQIGRHPVLLSWSLLWTWES